ncbi:hypothetical protein [Amycolatopsis benzoatilytica]|nr:hypothetical protein [Amycolatopsis benzoatilytica]
MFAQISARAAASEVDSPARAPDASAGALPAAGRDRVASYDAEVTRYTS